MSFRHCVRKSVRFWSSAKKKKNQSKGIRITSAAEMLLYGDNFTANRSNLSFFFVNGNRLLTRPSIHADDSWSQLFPSPRHVVNYRKFVFIFRFSLMSKREKKIYCPEWIVIRFTAAAKIIMKSCEWSK